MGEMPCAVRVLRVVLLTGVALATAVFGFLRWSGGGLEVAQEPDEPTAMISEAVRNGHTVVTISVRESGLVRDAFDQEVDFAQKRGPYRIVFRCEDDAVQVATGTFTVVRQATATRDPRVRRVHLDLVDDPAC